MTADPSTGREITPGDNAPTDLPRLWFHTASIESEHPNLANLVSQACTEIKHLRAECGRFRQHSMILNRVAWQIHSALRVIPEGADEHWGDIEKDLPHICELIRKGLEVGDV